MKWKSIVGIIMIIILFSGCKQNPLDGLEEDKIIGEEYIIGEDVGDSEADKIMMKIKEGTLTDKGVTLVIESTADSEIIFGSYYVLEGNNADHWEKMPYVIDENSVGWDDIAYVLGDDNNRQIGVNIDWEWLYGQLDEGKYRIKKEYFINNDYLTKHTITAEFIIGLDEKMAKKYYFEPNVSIIEGTLITRLHYGPPGYGEDPDKDEKVYPFILQLNEPINIIAGDNDEMNPSDVSDVLEVQLVLPGEPYISKAKQYKNKHMKVQGTFFSAFTGHHYTEALLVVDEILD